MAAKEELVSVIVPVYNCEKYLQKCVLAILNGEYRNIEVILVNDGSTDGSLAICNQLKNTDNRVKVCSQINRGPSAARNKGIELALGEYLVFVDADDEVSKSYVRNLVNLIHKKSAVLGQVSYTQDINNISHEEYTETAALRSCTSDDAFKWLWCRGIIDGYLWNKIFVREIVVKNKICFYEEARIWEDSLFVFEYLTASKGTCFSCENRDYFYRVNNESITHHPETVNMLDAKCMVIQRISELNRKKKGEELNTELNRVKLALLRGRVKKLKPIAGNVWDRYKGLIRTSQGLSLAARIKAELMLLILKCLKR